MLKFYATKSVGHFWAFSLVTLLTFKMSRTLNTWTTEHLTHLTRLKHQNTKTGKSRVFLWKRRRPSAGDVFTKKHGLYCLSRQCRFLLFSFCLSCVVFFVFFCSSFPGNSPYLHGHWHCARSKARGGAQKWPKFTLGRPLRRTAQNFALFFLSPAGNFILLLSLGVFVEFWWCFWRPGRSNVHVWALGLWCETPADSGPRERAHLSAPAFKNTTKIPRKDQKKREERNKIVAGEKKSAKFWAPHPSGPHQGLGDHPERPPPFGASQFGATLRRRVGLQRHWPKQVNTFTGLNRSGLYRSNWPKAVLAKTGQTGWLKAVWPEQVAAFGQPHLRAPTSGPHHPTRPPPNPPTPTKKKFGQMRSGQIPNKNGQIRPKNFGQMWYWSNSDWPKAAKKGWPNQVWPNVVGRDLNNHVRAVGLSGFVFLNFLVCNFQLYVSNLYFSVFSFSFLQFLDSSF